MNEEVGRGDWHNYVFQTRHGHHRIYSRATNSVWRRLKQHNHNLAGGLHNTKSWGPGNAMVAIVIGPMSQTVALALEWRLKRTIVGGGGLAGRLRAIVKILRQPTFRTKSVRLERQELQSLIIRTAMSGEAVTTITGLRVSELLELAKWQFGEL